MIFNSFQFIWVFPIIFFSYYCLTYLFKHSALQPRYSNLLLLVVSYALYLQWNPVHTLVLLWVTLVTYLFAILIEKRQAYSKQKYLITFGIVLALLPLFIYKYYDFLLNSITELCGRYGIEIGLAGMNWSLPLGISFFSFQAVGYLFEVYKNREKAERNLVNYMLFVSFFPQISSGPISKSSELLPQIRNRRPLDFEKMTEGFRQLLLGLFLKLVIANHLGLYVDTIYSTYEIHSGTTCLLASICYSFQLYADFAGYSLMAIGVGQIMGFQLPTNFNHPYRAYSVSDFWKRWHITLTRWLTTYVYIPLGGSRCSSIKCYKNILITFLVSGIWHGANWTFIFWGLLHGCILLVERMLKLKEKSKNVIKNAVRVFITFMLVNFLWILFRMPSISDAALFIKKILTSPGRLELVDNTTTIYIAISLLLIVLYEIGMKSLNPFKSSYRIIRWSSYVVCLLAILLLGVLDTSQFIYVNF